MIQQSTEQEGQRRLRRARSWNQSGQMSTTQKNLSEVRESMYTGVCVRKHPDLGGWVLSQRWERRLAVRDLCSSSGSHRSCEGLQMGEG